MQSIFAESSVEPSLAIQPGPACTEQPSRARPARRRWLRRLIVAATMCLLVALFHAPLFRLLASGLIVDDPLTKTDAVVFAGRNGPFAQVPLDEVAELYRTGQAGRVILIEDTSSRIVRQGILPTLDSVVRRELTKRGVPEKSITTLSVDVRGERDIPARLGQWLETNPGSTATVLQPELSSREERIVLARVLGADQMNLVHVHTLADPRYNRDNWWRTRRGVTELASCYIGLGHTLFVPETEPPARWDADEFERSLKK